MTQVVKVYQIANELGMDTDVVVAKIRAFGIPVNNKMSKLDGSVAEQIKSTLLREKQQDWVEIQMADGVIKRVKKTPPAAPPAPTPPVVPARVEPAIPVATRAEPVEERKPAKEPAREIKPPKPEIPVASKAEPPAAEVRREKSTPPEVSAPAEPVAAEPAEEPRRIDEPARAEPAAEPVREEPVAAAPAAPAPTETAPVAKEEPATTAPSAVEEEPAATAAEAKESSPPAPAAPPQHEEEYAQQATPAAQQAVEEASTATEPVSAAEETYESAEEEKEQTPSTPPSADDSDENKATAKPNEERKPELSMPAATPVTDPRGRVPTLPNTTVRPPEPVKPLETRPSIPPGNPSSKPMQGISVWDPKTKQVTHQATPRRVEVFPNRPGPQQSTAKPNNPAATAQNKPGPAAKSGPGGRPNAPNAPPRRQEQRNPRGPAVPSTKERSVEKRVVRIEGQVSLQELARRMSVKSSDVLVKLLSMGMPGVNINSLLDSDTAKLLAQEFNYEVEDVAVNIDDALRAILPEFKENPADSVPRPPVVTVMGHVDHGKTTLLDAILGMRVAEGEAGGITQKVSAYRVETKKGPVVFFDTPGHEAFTKLRARGAQTTDVAVLVVAADDGVMPTTIEAINHARMGDVPIVVALNKMDKPDAKPDRVLEQLMAHEVVAEQFGGETLVCRVSAKQRTGIEELLENLALQSEVLDLRANPKRPGRGTVFDATLDKGRGVVARVLVQDGTVRAGDVVLTGTSFGKIRAMFDDRGKPIAKAGPSTPIEILGLSDLPVAGDEIYVVQDLKKAQAFAEEHKKKGPSVAAPAAFDVSTFLAEGQRATVGVIIKAEAQASVEALEKALKELSTEKVQVTVVHTGIGGITESDVNLAIASNKFPTVVLGFNVRPQGKAQQIADTAKVQLRLYTIIYDAIEELKLLMAGQLKPTKVEKALGKAEVRQVFNITRVGVVAGCYVTEGKILRTARARLVRDSVPVWEGKLASLRRFKEDAKEVSSGYECGIGLENYSDIKPGDVIEAFELEEVAPTL